MPLCPNIRQNKSYDLVLVGSFFQKKDMNSKSCYYRNISDPIPV